MRQTAARLNRAWLTVVGLVLLLAGAAVILIGADLLQPLARTVGLTLTRPEPSDHVLGARAASVFALTWVAVLVAVLGVLLAVLALAWLAGQIPRTNQAKPFRLHDTAADGLTRITPDVLTNAVEAQITDLPDVADASAVLRGNVSEPDLTIKVTATERAHLPQLLQTIHTRIADDFGGALDTQLRRLGVQVEIGTTRTKKHQITLDPENLARPAVR